MKRKRYSVEQIVVAVKQHDMGLPAGDIARKLGIAEQTFYRWKKQYGGLEATEVRELTQLREENAKLKKLVAELSLDKAMLQEIAAKKWWAHQSAGLWCAISAGSMGSANGMRVGWCRCPGRPCGIRPGGRPNRPCGNAFATSP